MPFRRFGRPGLLGLAARTAVVAGTASAVGGAVREHEERAAEDRAAEERVAAERAAAERAAAERSVVDVPAAPDLLGELERLGRLRQQGLLSDDEFAAAKQRLIGG
ncbi:MULTISPECIES: SHOCT domain-containing protein [unclassified Curtobacterium]|uniref:SHOCT domain-containing protein n=1 Tax=unclassified Curtobacterium TaxID=257496 RepID=UPI000F46CC71|nr:MULTISPECIES: SHOCT domain-containing protein [unclassified Curtobacterium]ROQ05993.1 putative oligomerization/nucleic acid binding protein [Curtobacterium sp. PhB171]ROQ22860.1 putative oligomerization/nucleic acid binding protein [Curtobacterium sp. PhB170]ROS34188.1 putative oligomerization/nucleic acid binding protein [Curtobacterium sp. PhB131]ROS66787.1 putative oligomerization/nucleic acid binding protein [Curtobacterium sp. PhB141]